MASGTVSLFLQSLLLFIFYVIDQVNNKPHRAEPSWEANIFSVSQEIPRIVMKLVFHYSVRNSPPFVPPSWHYSIPRPNVPFSCRSIVISPFRLSFGPQNWLFNQDFSTKILSVSLWSSTHATCPVHLVFLDLIILSIFWAVPIRHPFSVQFSPSSCYFLLRAVTLSSTFPSVCGNIVETRSKPILDVN